MTDEVYEFKTSFDGVEQTFYTVQSAMAMVEDLENPTGTISLNGTVIIRYKDGQVQDATRSGVES